MENSSQLDDDLLKDIYQGEMKPILEPIRTDFKPWHKPRKHYVRLKQWCHETRKLLKQFESDQNEELRYFGMPGEDLLDIRVLKEVCAKSNVKLRYLGFDCSLASSNLNLSRHEVNSDEFIHQSSLVIKDQLED